MPLANVFNWMELLVLDNSLGGSESCYLGGCKEKRDEVRIMTKRKLKRECGGLFMMISL